MEFLSIRKFSACSRKTRDTLNHAKAMRLLEEIQMQAVRGGLDSMSGDEIDAEIDAYRNSKSRKKKKAK